MQAPFDILFGTAQANKDDPRFALVDPPDRRFVLVLREGAKWRGFGARHMESGENDGQVVAGPIQDCRKYRAGSFSASRGTQ